MKKQFTIFVFFVLFLLIVSQLVWVNQVLERDKSRFKEELSTSITDLVMFQTSKQTFELFRVNPQSPSITLERVAPDSVPAHAKSYGNYDEDNNEENTSLSKFIESAMAEMLLEKETLNLHIIDSLFRNNFQYASELLSYSLKTEKYNEITDSLYFGSNAIKQLNDTTKGVFITIPLGTSGTYRFISHFIFKQSTITRSLIGLAAMSGIAVIAVAIILFLLLYQLQRQMYRLHLQEKQVRGIVHDLKSPLSYIFSMLGLFEMGENDEQKNNLLAEGKLRIKRLSDSIDRMLSEVKLSETKSAALQRESYDIETNCREITNELRVIYNEKNITTIFTIDPDASTVYVDSFYFNNCLRNLLDNAVKYSDDTPVIRIAARKEKNNTVISVADNGKGIPKKEQRLVFTSFFRSSYPTSVRGHGIGLSTVQQIIKAHDGKIKLKSKPGTGTTFTITLPDKPIKLWKNH